MDNSARQHQGTKAAVARPAPAIAPETDLLALAMSASAAPPRRTTWLDGPSYRPTPLSHRFRETA